MNKFYQFKNSETADTTELLVYGDITSWKWAEEDVTGFDFAKELADVTTPNLVVRINSYGGEVAQGLGIYNMLKAFPGKVTTMCDGFACSAASVVFMAGTKRIMPKTSLLLIHNAWTFAMGDSNAMRKMADDLEKITQPSVEAYKAVSTLSEAEIKKLMDVETWITADEALAYGFATDVVEDEPKQELEKHYMFKLVTRVKELEQKQTADSPQKPKDAWSSFFNGKKGN